VGLSDRVEAEQRALVDCLERITEHSGRTVLELGNRLGAVMSQGMSLRSLMREVASKVGTTHTAALIEDLEARCDSFRRLAASPGYEEFDDACIELADTLQREVERLTRGDRRRQAEILTVTNELGALTGTLIAQTGRAISALQFQDPAIQALRRIDSLVLDLRRAIDDEATVVRWAHRVGAARGARETTPRALASRALTIREHTRRRVEAFEAETREAVTEVERIHADLRAVTHAQVAKSEQTAQILRPSEPEAEAVHRYCASFGAALDQLEAMVHTGRRVTGRLSHMLELSQTALEEGYGGRSSIAVATDHVSAAAERIAREDSAPSLAVCARDELRRTQITLDHLAAHDGWRRALAEKVEQRQEAMREIFAGFERPLHAGTEDDPLPRLLRSASGAADRLFDIIVEELDLDPATIEPEEDWQATLAEETHEGNEQDDGLILL